MAPLKLSELESYSEHPTVSYQHISQIHVHRCTLPSYTGTTPYPPMYHTHPCTSQTGGSQVTTSLKQVWTVLRRRSLELHKMERGHPPLQRLRLTQGWLNNALLFLQSWCSIVGTLLLLPAWCLPCSDGECSPPPPPPPAVVPGRSHWASDIGSCPASPAGEGVALITLEVTKDCKLPQ